MKELNLGDFIYHLDKHTTIDQLVVTEKKVSEKIYLGKYSKEVSYVANKHPIKISFIAIPNSFRAEDGSLIFTSKEDLLKYMIDQLSYYDEERG